MLQKIDQGIYKGTNKDFSAFACAQTGFVDSKWFLKVVDEWYARYEGDTIEYREDLIESYYRIKNKVMNSSKSRKALNFDINSNLLRKYYPSKNYRRGWKDIKAFLENSGFIHRQYSGYVSKDDIAITDVIYLAKEMSKRLTW